jgi:hypothetical protein
MARQKGPIFFVGTIGNLVYYKRGNNYFVKEKSSPSKEQIKKSKSFIETRKRNNEFGGGSTIGKAFRDSIPSLIKTFGDSDLSGRLTRLFQTVIKNSKGLQGRRSAELKRSKDIIKDFQFNKERSFDQIFNTIIQYKVNVNRKKVTVLIPKFNPRNFIDIPCGASHFKLIVAAVLISDYVFNTKAKKYHPLEKQYDDKSFILESDYFTVQEDLKDIRLNIKFKSFIPSCFNIIICIGIKFYKEENESEKYELSTNRSMKIGEVL